MAEGLRYEEPAPITDKQLEEEMASGDSDRQYPALVRASLWIPESPVLLRHLVAQLDANEYPVVEGALTASSHVARLAGFEHPREITSRMKRLTRDAYVADHARSCLWDVQHFCDVGLWRKVRRVLRR
ncbi:MAG: hypothetical protein AAFQ43_13540 [Bacteroidota bacterium]